MESNRIHIQMICTFDAATASNSDKKIVNRFPQSSFPREFSYYSTTAHCVHVLQLHLRTFQLECNRQNSANKLLFYIYDSICYFSSGF